jgi:predicted aminopeptidase
VKRAPWSGALRACALVACLLPLSGCYLTHVTGGQLGILSGREPIDEVLERSDLSDDARTKLQLVLTTRDYAMREVGLAESGSYTTYYDTGGEPVVWNVSACARDSFLPFVWSFPIVGVLPYKGYFDPELAQEEAQELRALELDVLLLPVPAYSTLGWFDDPFFSSMLSYDEATIAEIVVHELAHATVFIEADADFNETLATFVGVQGAKDLFRAQGGDDDPRLRALDDSAHDEGLLNEALKALRDELWRIYEASGARARKLALKEEAVARFRERFEREVRPRLRDTERFSYLRDPQVALNNAFLLQYARYHGDLGKFEALYRQCDQDLARTVEALEALAQESDPRAALEARVGASKK